MLYISNDKIGKINKMSFKRDNDNNFKYTELE